MKIGFNEGCNRFCADHSVLKDLEYCEKYGFDYIDVQSECLNRDLVAGKYTIEELGEWFKNHNLKCSLQCPYFLQYETDAGRERCGHGRVG